VASQNGVEIDLLVRGICCLRAGVKGISSNIRVHAVVDRFLEHARIYCFRNGGQEEVYCSSADWMPRNFRRRVELMWPIVEESLKRRMIDEILGTMRSDNLKGWLLQPDGTYHQVVAKEGDALVRSQVRFMELARERSREQDTILAIGSKQFATASSPRAALDKLRRKDRKKKKRKRDPHL
jgi:polyphosphate kinase